MPYLEDGVASSGLEQHQHDDNGAEQGRGRPAAAQPRAHTHGTPRLSTRAPEEEAGAAEVTSPVGEALRPPVARAPTGHVAGGARGGRAQWAGLGLPHV